MSYYKTTDTSRDKEMEQYWIELTDIPFDYPEETGLSDMALAHDWLHFKKGTERDEIWHWFDENHSKGVAWLLYEFEY